MSYPLMAWANVCSSEGRRPDDAEGGLLLDAPEGPGLLELLVQIRDAHVTTIDVVTRIVKPH